MKKNILIISHDKIGSSMAGPGIRYHYMANELSKQHNVSVGFFDEAYLPDVHFQTQYKRLHIPKENFIEVFKNIEVVIAMWLSPEMIDYCNSNEIFIVFDVYAPVPVENLSLFLYGADSIDKYTDHTYKQSYSMYKNFFEKGDLFLFSNRRQLDFWTGYVFGSDIVSVTGYKIRPFFDRFIYAPMGIDTSTENKHKKNVMRGIIKGLERNDKILIWTGGIWNWFDAQVLIEAMRIVATTNPEIKLVFFGTKHPNPNVPKMKEASDALKKAKKYGLLNKNVYMLEGWVEYSERINYLLEADIAINTAKSTIESEFSHRTRVLDHFLVGLPTIATQGDFLTDEVIVKNRLGLAVPPSNPEELASTIIKSFEKSNYKIMKENVKHIRPNYDWSVTLSALVSTLKNCPEKLSLVNEDKPKKISQKTKLYKSAKRYIPLPVKKMLIKLYIYAK